METKNNQLLTVKKRASIHNNRLKVKIKRQVSNRSI